MLYPPEFGSDPLFPRASDFEIVYKDAAAGQAVICHRGFNQGQVIARMAGHVVPDIRQHTLQISRTRHNYDPYFSGYFLHSCAPNVFLDMENMTVVALQDIAPGSYITMDYAQTEDFLFKQFPCGCGSVNCRGWIHGRLEVPIRAALNEPALRGESGISEGFSQDAVQVNAGVGWLSVSPASDEQRELVG
jgi:uncharacterized protein